ncbi:ABC transporter ATP-binding protein [Dorea sp. D27]|uniref:ABC transporter ATP-binding protein n=1 Tax=Dorea sp. D27 TaxID=658665 RepID=UPI0006735F7F|nr:ABC transporter ATP-binding protein [Dorea sp. D27]KMZ54230.1 peptide ABC transporter, ATP-binding protein [Dorea sp. D27]
MDEHLLEVRHLKKYFRTGKNQVQKAVDDVSFYVRKGETLGIVGESGCGKTTCGRTCMGIYEATEGEVLYKGMRVGSLRGKEKRRFTKEVQMIFQDPYASLDPRMKVGDIIAEGMLAHNMAGNGRECMEKVEELLAAVGLSGGHRDRYVHEFSGGQRQRIGIARSLAVEPELIVCDEPISALDVSVQAQIVNLLMTLQEERGLTYMFIAHDLSMVRYISDRVAVMYLGKIVEIAPSGLLYNNPKHPYTRALLSAVPIPDPKAQAERKRFSLRGERTSPANPGSGCRFCGRCDEATDICAQEEPMLREVEKGHFAACHLYKEESASAGPDNGQAGAKGGNAG